MSLRVRLLAGMVVLVTIGLVVAAAATYAEQRSFLYDRLDQEVLAARYPIAKRLTVGPGQRPGAGTKAGTNAGGVARGVFGTPAFGDGRGSRLTPFLPPGTFGELLGPGHRLIGQPVSFSFDAVKVKVPALPASFPITRLGQRPRLFTFADKAGGMRYRALAVAVPAGTVFVALPLSEVDQTLHRLVVVEALVGAGVIIALLVLGWFVIRVGLRPLTRIGRVASEIAGGDLSRRVTPADSRSEVGRLGLSLNEMLGQIERAFADRTASEDRLRRFLADASHELRTPLAAVLGYAELYRLGVASDPEAVGRSMARIEAEAARMGGLVEGLLTLARLDQLPESEQHPVEVSELASHAADDARAMAPEHEVRFRADGTHWVLADPDALRQVLANLLRNAVIHTPAETLIELTVSRRGDRVIIEVRDHGPGLPEGAGELVFERFWRNKGGRSRGPGGAGLGLAIVKALVLAHHGEVHAENAPGGGARFEVTLPVRREKHSGNAQPLPKLSIDESATLHS